MSGKSSHSHHHHHRHHSSSRSHHPESDIAASMSGMSIRDDPRQAEGGKHKGDSKHSSHRSHRDDDGQSRDSKHSSHRSGRDDDGQSRASSSRRHSRHEQPPTVIDHSSGKGTAQRPPRTHRPPPLAYENSAHRGTGSSRYSQAPSAAPSRSEASSAATSRHSRVPSEAPSRHSRAPSAAPSRHSRAPSATPTRSTFEFDDDRTVGPDDSISSCGPSKAYSLRHSNAPSRARSPPTSTYDNVSRALVPRASSRASSSRDSYAGSRAPYADSRASYADSRASYADSRAPYADSRAPHADSRAPSSYSYADSRAPSGYSYAGSRAPTSYSHAPSGAPSSRYSQREVGGCCPTYHDGLNDYDSEVTAGPRTVVACAVPSGAAVASVSAQSIDYVNPSTGEMIGITNVQYKVAYAPGDRRLRRR